MLCSLCQRDGAGSRQESKAMAPERSQQILVIVRPCYWCSLRVSERAALQLDDVVIEVNRPHLRVRCDATKGGRSLREPLWWDRGTLANLLA